MKVARWNDRNFYALKQAVMKTHKTLHKFSKQLRLALAQPVRPLLTETRTHDEETGPDDPLPPLPALGPDAFVINPTVFASSNIGLGNDHLRKMTLKFIKHSKSIMKSLNCLEHITDLEEITG